MIVITGATGHFGKATVQFLLKKGVQPSSIRAFVRDAEKAKDLKAAGVEIAIGDYSDTASMKKAFQGASKLLLISGSDIANRHQQQLNAVQAAKDSGVKHIVYTSFIRKNETESSPIAFVGNSHIATDNAIKASGIPYTILLNSLYTDMLPMFFGEKVVETGVFLPAGNGKAAYATREDMAEAAAVVLSGSGHENKSYVLAGETNDTLQQAADAISAATGKKVPFVSPPVAAYHSALQGAGVPEHFIHMMSAFSQAIEQGEFEVTSTDLPGLLGRKPTSLQQYLTSVYSK